MSSTKMDDFTATYTANEDDSNPWSEWTKRVVYIGTIIIVVIGLSVAGPIYGQVLLALFVCLLLFLPIRVVMKRANWSYTSSTIIVFIVYVLLLLIFVLWFAAPVIRFVSELTAATTDLLAEGVRYLQSYSPGDADIYDAAGNVVVDLHSIAEPLSQIVRNVETDEVANIVPLFVKILSTGIGFVGSLIGIGYNLFFINFVAFLFLLEIPRIYDFLIVSMSPAQKRQIGTLLLRFDRTWTGYLMGTVVVSVIGAILTWILLTVLGIPNPTGVTVVTTIVLQIPFFGPVLGTLVSFLAGLIGGSTALPYDPLIVGLLSGALFFFVRGFMVGNFVYPRIVGKSVEVPTVIVMISLSFFGSIAGILGMFLSPILAAVVRDIGYFTIRKLQVKEPFVGASETGFLYSNMLKGISEKPVEDSQRAE